MSKDPRTMLPVNTGFPGADLLPVEKFGTETETEKQIKSFLNKQLDTKISLEKHFAQHRKFANSSIFTPLTQLISGACSLEKFKEIENAEEKRQELQRSGLNEDEINFVIQVQNNEPIKEKRFGANPDALVEKKRHIEKKLIAHQQELQKPETFKNVKTLTRHEMEIEKTLYAGCNTKKQMNTLIVERTIPVLSENDPFKQVKELSERLSQKLRRKRKKQTQIHGSDNVSQAFENPNGFVYDPNIHHVIVPLEDDEIKRKKLQLDEIRSISRFTNYEPGIPNKVLFLKNLHPKVDIRELHAVFGRFEFENAAPIHYRLLTGRMRGQAFLEFTNVKTAEKALTFANGYMLKERPIIIQYGREKRMQAKSNAV